MKYLKMFVLVLSVLLVFVLLWGISTQLFKLLFWSVGLPVIPLMCCVFGLIFSAVALLTTFTLVE